MNELVSVVIPVYKTAQWLEACVYSILNQTYSNIEIILVDDGSPDESPVLCDNLAKKYNNISVIHKTNGGLSSARNAGIDTAKGKYILFLDSDDSLDKDAIFDMVCIAEKEQSDAVYPNSYYKVYENGKKEHALHFPKDLFVSDSKKFAIDILIEKSRARRSTAVLYNLVKIKQVESCRYPLGIISEDFFFNLRFLKHANKISLYEKPSLYNLKRKGSISSSYYKDFFNTILKMDDEVKNFFDGINNESYSIEGKRESLFFRNAYIFALNIIGDKKTPYKERKKLCLEIFKHERFEQAIQPQMGKPYFEGKIKRIFFGFALWGLRKKMYTMVCAISWLAAKFNAI